MSDKNILITGAAGFIGYHVAQSLLKSGFVVYGMDNLNDYYDVSLKKSRVSHLKENECFEFQKADITDKVKLDKIFNSRNPSVVIHLAAQAGVRHSIDNPRAYIDSNIQGFFNILEACRNHSVDHLIYASSSSGYGGNSKIPFAVEDNVDHPVSLYAATKKSNELMAHTYSHLYGIPTTGLRFFTVYGPWGRPDMAYFKFTKNIIEGKPIDVYNHGAMERDFTYIDDIVTGIVSLIDKPHIDKGKVPYKLYNIGRGEPVKLERFISILEEKIGVKAKKNYMDMQPGDVLKTYADVSGLEEAIGFRPETSLEDGLDRFVEWYKGYYGVNA